MMDSRRRKEHDCNQDKEGGSERSTVLRYRLEQHVEAG
jgi:hypothetical protein